MKTIIFIIFITIITIKVNPGKAWASELSLGVSPPILQIVADPPASIKAPITIKNLAEETVTLDVKLKPFTAADAENGQIRYLKPNESFGENPLMFEFVQVVDNDHVVKNLTLAPGQQKNLNLHIGILKDELPSDYYFSVVFVGSSEEQNPEPSSTNLAQTTGGIAINVLLSISPDKPRGSIEEFSAPFFVEKGPVPFTVRVKNKGKNFFTPNGTILIKNMFGQTVGKVELLPVNILAGTTRAIPDILQSPDATPSSTFNFQLSTFNSPKAYWHESLLFGPYTATLTLALSDQGPVFQKTIRFIGFPVQAVVGLALAVIILIFIKNRLSTRL